MTFITQVLLLAMLGILFEIVYDSWANTSLCRIRIKCWLFVTRGLTVASDVTKEFLPIWKVLWSNRDLTGVWRWRFFMLLPVWSYTTWYNVTSSHQLIKDCEKTQIVPERYSIKLFLPLKKNLIAVTLLPQIKEQTSISIFIEIYRTSSSCLTDVNIVELWQDWSRLWSLFQQKSLEFWYEFKFWQCYSIPFGMNDSIPGTQLVVIMFSSSVSTWITRRCLEFRKAK